MHLIYYPNTRSGKTYCYVGETVWDKQLKKYEKPRVAIGKLEGEPPIFVPNKYLRSLIETHNADSTAVNEREKLIIDTVQSKYNIDEINHTQHTNTVVAAKTAWAVFSGPSIIFGGITQRYRIDAILEKAFGEEDAQEILSLAWYLASEGDALSNCDAWLSHYETPAGRAISSQEVTRLLDQMSQDGIMTFYKEWLRILECSEDKVLYDLTSISWYGIGINMAGWGYNRDKENLPQVNYALMCSRNTGMPLFAWPLDGSISDVSTLQNTLQFLKKLDYHPDCIMMDRAFGSEANISFMLKERYVFLQALRINTHWIREIIDGGSAMRLRPDSMLKVEDRVYYASTTLCQWVIINRKNRNGKVVSEVKVHQCKESKKEQYIAKNGETIEAQYTCSVHVLRCHDLVGNQWDRFMEKLNTEYTRLLADEGAEPHNDYKRYFVIERKKWARRRSIDFNMETITKHYNNYAGYVSFITNDKTILTAKDALAEYSTRDYIEKGFDEMKNELDMNRIRVHTDNRMKARLLIQFIAEIYVREIRIKLKESDICRKMTRTQISSHIKGIYKIKFKNKYKDVRPELSKSQRSILEALGFGDSR